MEKIFSNSEFVLRARRIERKAGRQVACDNIFAQQIAQPLFDAGVRVAGVTERTDYRSDTSIFQRHKYTLLYQGTMFVEYNDAEYMLAPGDIAFLPVGHKGCRYGKGPVRFLYFEILDCPRWEPMKKVGPYHRPYDCADLMLVLFSHILQAHHLGKPSMIPLALACSRTVVDLLDQEIRLAGMQAHKADPRMQQLVEEMGEHPDTDWNVADMANRLHCTERHFRRIFRAEYSQSPRDMIIRQRMHKAVDLLTRSNLSIDAVARAIGYESPFAFSRLFKQRIGLSPFAYRSQAQ